MKSYDQNQESKQIICLDANTLYGYGMFKFSPTSGLKKKDQKEFDLNKYTRNSLEGCALGVDLEYDKEFREF